MDQAEDDFRLDLPSGVSQYCAYTTAGESKPHRYRLTIISYAGEKHIDNYTYIDSGSPCCIIVFHVYRPMYVGCTGLSSSFNLHA
jgi:hypothetical protein